MPNTTIHLVLQAAGTLPGWRKTSDWSLALILLGSALPDLPWILQRALRQLMILVRDPPGPAGDPIYYDLRLYFGVQSSLFFCCLMALALALLTGKPGRSFLLLTCTALLHLCLDAVQIKWANGVLLFAPFDWHLQRLDLFWPEGFPTDLVSALSLACLPGLAWLALRKPPTTQPFSMKHWPLAGLTLAIWLLAPLLFVNALRTTDAFSIASLTAPADSQTIELGAARVFERDGHLWVRTMSERELLLDSGMAQPSPPQQALERPVQPGKVSLRGTLGNPRSLDIGSSYSSSRPTLRVTDYHQHRTVSREILSGIGLTFVALLWAALIWKSRPSANHLRL